MNHVSSISQEAEKGSVALMGKSSATKIVLLIDAPRTAWLHVVCTAVYFPPPPIDAPTVVVSLRMYCFSYVVASNTIPVTRAFFLTSMNIYTHYV